MASAQTGYGAAPSPADHEPYWRWKLWRKVSNNVSTVSNQFAVWVTVGFFYCDSTGAISDPNGTAPPTGNPEVGGAAHNLRHRALFILDRSTARIVSGRNLWDTATSPNPVQSPIRVVYRRYVESKRGGWN